MIRLHAHPLNPPLPYASSTHTGSLRNRNQLLTGSPVSNWFLFLRLPSEGEGGGHGVESFDLKKASINH
jgi:hypothetical protein